MSVLLDTGVLFAFLNADDERHADARRIIAAIAEGRHGSPYVSDHVVNELFTLIRAKTRNPHLETAAKRLLPLPQPELPNLRIVSLGHERIPDLVAAFERGRDLGITFTDASHLVLMETLGIDYLATFDRRLQALARNVPA